MFSFAGILIDSCLCLQDVRGWQLCERNRRLPNAEVAEDVWVGVVLFHKRSFIPEVGEGPPSEV